jgi:hypothetical protein
MYRGLDDFMSSNMYDSHLFLSSPHSLQERIHYSSHVPSNDNGHAISASRTWGSASAKPIPLNEIAVEVHTTLNHSVTSQAIRHGLNNNMDEELHNKLHELVY